MTDISIGNAAATSAEDTRFDAKGRLNPELMTDNALLRELVEGQRALQDALEDLSQSPMIGAIMNGQSPLMAMMGKR